MAGIAKDIGGGFSLGASTVVDELGLRVILITAEPPVADAIFVQVLAGIAKPLDDRFVRDAVIEQMIDLVAEDRRQASDFAVAAGFGLAGLELQGQVVF